MDRRAGKENGRLICTADQCVAWGIRRSAVTEAQRDAIARGLIYRSEDGAGYFAPLGESPPKPLWPWLITGARWITGT